MKQIFVEEALARDGDKYYCICSHRDDNWKVVQYILALIAFENDDLQFGDFTYFNTIQSEKYKARLYKKFNEIIQCKNNCRH